MMQANVNIASDTFYTLFSLSLKKRGILNEPFNTSVTATARLHVDMYSMFLQVTLCHR